MTTILTQLQKQRDTLSQQVSIIDNVIADLRAIPAIANGNGAPKKNGATTTRAVKSSYWSKMSKAERSIERKRRLQVAADNRAARLAAATTTTEV